MKLIHCKDCNADLPEDAFSANVLSKTGRAFYCKVHAAARQRAWKHANREKVAQWKKDYLQRQKNSG